MDKKRDLVVEELEVHGGEGWAGKAGGLTPSQHAT
jgi:hypothetical protein